MTRSPGRVLVRFSFRPLSGASGRARLGAPFPFSVHTTQNSTYENIDCILCAYDRSRWGLDLDG